MEKQSTSRFLRLVIAVLALFMLVMGGTILSACGGEEHTHNFTKDASKSIAATCGTTGFDVYTCDCDLAYGQMTPASGSHEWSNHYCSKCGMSEYTAAADLTKVNSFVDSFKQVDLTEVIAKLNALDGSVTEKLDALATELENAVKAVNDKVDGIDFHIAHEWVSADISVAPTCTTYGFDVEKCSICGVTHVVKTTAALGGNHKFTEKDKVGYMEATCQHRAYFIYECNVCHAPIQVLDETNPNLGDHHFVPTLDDDGNPQYTVDPTEDSKGMVKAHCEYCGEESEIEGETTLPHDHNYVRATEEVLAALEAAGHDVSELEACREVTCEETGIEYNICTKCGEIEGEITVTPALGHIPVEDAEQEYDIMDVRLPGADGQTNYYYKDTDEAHTTPLNARGLWYYTCAHCGEKIVVKTAATEEAEATYRLAVESDYIWEKHDWHSLADLGGTYAGHTNKAPTCTTAGERWWYCTDSNCREGHVTEGNPTVWYLEILPPLGHLFNKEYHSTVTKAPTCTEPGILTFTCEREGCTVDVTVTFTGDYSDWTNEAWLNGGKPEGFEDLWTIEFTVGGEPATVVEYEDSLEELQGLLLPKGHKWTKSEEKSQDANCDHGTITVYECKCECCAECECEDYTIREDGVGHLGEVTVEFNTYELVDPLFCGVEKGTIRVHHVATYCTECEKWVEDVTTEEQVKGRHFPFDRSKLEEIAVTVVPGEAYDLEAFNKYVAIWDAIDAWYVNNAEYYFSTELTEFLFIRKAEGIYDDGYVVACYDCYETLYARVPGDHSDFEALTPAEVQGLLTSAEGEVDLWCDVELGSKTEIAEGAVVDGKGNTVYNCAPTNDGSANTAFRIGKGATVKNLTFAQGENGGWCTVLVYGSENVTFENVTFAQGTTIYFGGFSGKVEFIDCTFDGNACQVQFDVSGGHPSEINFQNCTINAHGNGIIDIVWGKNAEELKLTIEGCTFNNDSEEDTVDVVRISDERENPMTAEEFADLLKGNTFVGGAQITVNDDVVTEAE